MFSLLGKNSFRGAGQLSLFGKQKIPPWGKDGSVLTCCRRHSVDAQTYHRAKKKADSRDLRQQHLTKSDREGATSERNAGEERL